MRAFVKRWRWVWLVSCVAAAAAVVAACGSDEPASDTAQAEPTAASMTQPTAAPTAAMAESAPSVEVGLDVGQRAPDFTLTSHEGERITRASLEGSPVLLYFYTTW